MNNNVIICNGFNQYFDVPKIDGHRSALFRTAIVIKKKDFFDEWKSYSIFFWEIIQAIVSRLLMKAYIENSIYISSSDDLKLWLKQQRTIKSEYFFSPPAKIIFSDKEENLKILMTLENWFDIGKIEPYACSYTFSFYSYEADMNLRLTEVIIIALTNKSKNCDIVFFKECDSPKWYWPIASFLRSLFLG